MDLRRIQSAEVVSNTAGHSLLDYSTHEGLRTLGGNGSSIGQRQKGPNVYDTSQAAGFANKATHHESRR